jgi:DNA polymerase-3 subunit beta
MRFSCTQEKLKRGLAVVGALSGKNINLPVLNNVLVKVDATSVQLVSTNLETAVRATMRGKTESFGEFTVPARLFLDYVNLLPDDQVEVELVKDAVKVTCRKSSTAIKGLPASEFPLIPEVERGAVLYLEAKSFKDALKQVAFAVSSVESRPELTGVLFHANPAFAQGSLVLAATDSYRLAERTVTLLDKAGAKSSDRPVSIIVPGKALNEVSRILSLYSDAELAEPIEIVVGESQVSFRFGEVEILSRVIDGRYPDYRPIIPDRCVTEAGAEVAVLAQAVKGAALFSRNGLCDVHLSLDKGEGGIGVSALEGQLGTSQANVPAAVIGPKNDIAVNFRYLLDGLGAVEGKKVRLKMIDGANPCVLVPEESQPQDFIYIVMPIKQ